MGFYHISVFLVTTIILFHTLPTQVHGKSLTEELKDFCEIIPSDQMKTIAEAHIKTDKEFNEAIIFLQSDVWTNMIEDVEKNPEWTKLKNRLKHIGFNLDVLFKPFFEFLKVLHPIPNESGASRSFRSFFDEVEMILPIGKLLAMLHDKKHKSTVFQEFYEQLSSHEVHEMFEIVRNQQEVKRILNELKAMGARVDDILELFYGFMNWDSPKKVEKRESTEENKILAQEFDDFMKLIPWQILTNISDNHLANDREFNEAISFFQGPEFTEMLRSIKSRPEYVELDIYLSEAGLGITKIFTLLYDFIMNVKPMTRIVGDAKENSLRAYLDDIETAMPIADLFVLLENKMEHSGEFNRFIKKLSDKKVRNLVESVIHLPECVKLFEKLQKLGLKIRQIFIIIYAFLGWGSPFNDLK